MTSFAPYHRGGSGPPLVLLHGFTDSWRTWDLVIPALERSFDVLAPALPGHAGGPPLGPLGPGRLADGVERVLDQQGFGLARIAGNSLGAYVALQLAERGRAESVVAFAPGGGWAEGDDSYKETLGYQIELQAQVAVMAPRADELMSRPEGRRRAAGVTAVRWEHIPGELLAHQMRAIAACTEVAAMSEHAASHRWPLDFERITCPVRIVWGTADKLLPWPRAAERYRAALPHADWVILDDVGHCPQLDVPLEAAQLIT